ncbi:uncharacterized protein METZ01_LOCUS294278, partial [marine metagenome]
RGKRRGDMLCSRLEKVNLWIISHVTKMGLMNII